MSNDAVEYFDDIRIGGYDPLLPPQILQQEQPLSVNSKLTIGKARKECVDVLHGKDDRLIVVVGPCSIHDVNAAMEYGKKLKEIKDKLQKDLIIVMRSYFEKPRTTVGWKGLINDPELDGSFQINKGLRIARKLLCDLTNLGVPVGFELLDTISPQFLADVVSWGAIGARTTECQLHRELASGISFPVGFKNGTDGTITIAMDAIRAASHPHHFLGVTKQGLAAITKTKGNVDCHVILRGGSSGTNYDVESVTKVRGALKKAGLRETGIMIDCSHGNSRKMHKNQIGVCAEVAKQVAAGDKSIVGVMIESHLVEGKQDVGDKGRGGLVYGQSITDACVGWEDTVGMLEGLAKGVCERRALKV